VGLFPKGLSLYVEDLLDACSLTERGKTRVLLLRKWAPASDISAFAHTWLATRRSDDLRGEEVLEKRTEAQRQEAERALVSSDQRLRSWRTGVGADKP